MSSATDGFQIAGGQGRLTLAPAPDAAGPAWSLLAVGDFRVRPGRFAGGPEHHPTIAPDLAGRIAAADLALVNLEGPLCDGGQPIPKSGPNIAVDSGGAELLRQAGFDVVCLANNHIMDFGPAGLSATLQYLDDHGLRACGAGRDRAAARQPVEVTIGAQTRARIFSFCEREFGIAENDRPGAAWVSDPAALDAVRDAAAAADIVIVLAHGGLEMEPLPPPHRQAQLRRFIDAGAAIVLGHHPHVAQGWERYGRGIIFYSLGNFLFDFEEAVSYPDAEWGLAVQVHFRGPRPTHADLLVTRQRALTVDLDPQPATAALSLAHLADSTAALNDPARLQAWWESRALELFRTEYLAYLRAACGGPGTPPPPPPPGLLRRLLNGWRHTAAAPPAARPPNHQLLLNLIRNESHAAVLQTALAQLAHEAT